MLCLASSREGLPDFKFNESISFMVACEDQAEIDYFWGKLTDGGKESVYGWLKDKFGLSWRIVPKILGDMLKDPDEEKIEAVTATFPQREEARDRAAATGV